MKETRRGWLSTLKAGDEVCIKSIGTMGTFHEIVKIDKITPTMQFRIGSYLYNRNGELHQGWSYYTMEEATQEVRQKIENRNIRNKVKKTDYDLLSQEKINKIYSIIIEDKFNR